MTIILLTLLTNCFLPHIKVLETIWHYYFAYTIIISMESYIFSNIIVSIRNFVSFPSLQIFPNKYSILSWISYFLLLLLDEDTPRCLFDCQPLVLHVGCWAFIDIKCLWFNLVYLIRSLLSLTLFSM